MTPELFKAIDQQIRKIARIYCRTRTHQSISFEDLVADGWAGAIKVLPRFDKGRGFKLASFLAPRILGAILDGARRQDVLSRTQRKAVLQGLAPDVCTVSADASALSLTFRDRAACDRLNAIEAQIQFEQMFKKAEARLTDSEKIVLQRRWFEEHTLEEIAAELGVVSSRVSQIDNSAIAKIRAANAPDSNAFTC